jgi:hypothetical protein
MGFELHVSVDCIEAVHSHQANSLANGNAGAGCNLHHETTRQLVEHWNVMRNSMGLTSSSHRRRSLWHPRSYGTCR